jgi:hypothetical protein
VDVEPQADYEVKTPFGQGTFIVRTDVAPGTYRSRGGDGCYWARLRTTAGVPAAAAASMAPIRHLEACARSGRYRATGSGSSPLPPGRSSSRIVFQRLSRAYPFGALFHAWSANDRALVCRVRSRADPVQECRGLLARSLGRLRRAPHVLPQSAQSGNSASRSQESRGRGVFLTRGRMCFSLGKADGSASGLKGVA